MRGRNMKNRFVILIFTGGIDRPGTIWRTSYDSDTHNATVRARSIWEFYNHAHYVEVWDIKRDCRSWMP